MLGAVAVGSVMPSPTLLSVSDDVPQLPAPASNVTVYFFAPLPVRVTSTLVAPLLVSVRVAV